MRRPRTLTAFALAASLSACSGEDLQCGAAPIFALSGAPAAASAGAAVSVKVSRAGPACAYEGNGATTALEAVGGGTVVPASVAVPASGATVSWTLGPAPIAQRLQIAGHDGAAAEVIAEVAAPVVPTAFGEVHSWMAAQGLDSTTEDLAIADDGSIALGVDGAILDLRVAADGTITIKKRTLSGDPMPRAHGLAYDRKGTLWTADPAGKALHAIAKDGLVSTHLTTNGSAPLDGPNDVAVDSADRVVLSDPCRGELIYYDPVAKKVNDVESFDLLTEGGPNGFAFHGDDLYVVTENTTLLCPNATVKPKVTDNIASLFRIATKEGAFGARTLVETGFGLFGDGMAFDALGNLYVVVDTNEGVAIAESRVMVLRAGTAKLVPFVAFQKDTIIANVAFGKGNLGVTTMYAALLAVPPFTTEDKRGLVRFEVGVPGLPLLP